MVDTFADQRNGIKTGQGRRLPNTATPAPSYAIANVRVSAEQKAGPWRFTEFARIDNLFDRNYIGSVIVGDGNGRYYEPAPGRNGMVGVNARYTW